MTLEGVGVTQPEKHGPMQLPLKFGKQAHYAIALRKGEEAAEGAKKLREAGQPGGPEVVTKRGRPLRV